MWGTLLCNARLDIQVGRWCSSWGAEVLFGETCCGFHGCTKAVTSLESGHSGCAQRQATPLLGHNRLGDPRDLKDKSWG